MSTRAVTPCLPSFTSTYLAEDVELTEVAAAAVELAVGWPALPELVVLLFAAEAADVAAAVATDAAATGAVTTGEATTGVAADSPQAVAALWPLACHCPLAGQLPFPGLPRLG